MSDSDSSMDDPSYDPEEEEDEEEGEDLEEEEEELKSEFEPKILEAASAEVKAFAESEQKRFNFVFDVDAYAEDGVARKLEARANEFWGGIHEEISEYIESCEQVMKKMTAAAKKAASKTKKQ